MRRDRMTPMSHVRMASLHQVRCPLYRGSLARSKSFGRGLEPLRAALGDLLG
jgi:hypothetical protein